MVMELTFYVYSNSYLVIQLCCMLLFCILVMLLVLSELLVTTMPLSAAEKIHRYRDKIWENDNSNGRELEKSNVSAAWDYCQVSSCQRPHPHRVWNNWSDCQHLCWYRWLWHDNGTLPELLDSSTFLSLVDNKFPGIIVTDGLSGTLPELLHQFTDWRVC